MNFYLCGFENDFFCVAHVDNAALSSVTEVRRRLTVEDKIEIPYSTLAKYIAKIRPKVAKKQKRRARRAARKLRKKLRAEKKAKKALRRKRRGHPKAEASPSPQPVDTVESQISSFMGAGPVRATKAVAPKGPPLVLPTLPLFELGFSAAAPPKAAAKTKRRGTVNDLRACRKFLAQNPLQSEAERLESRADPHYIPPDHVAQATPPPPSGRPKRSCRLSRKDYTKQF